MPIYSDRGVCGLWRLPLLAVALLALCLPTACNSDDEDNAYSGEGITIDLSGVAINSFSLQADKKVLNNLDSVFFTIDLAGARIFNADSLPVGTDVSAIAVSMTTDQVSALEVTSHTAQGLDTVIDFLKNPATKLNFAYGPVQAKLTALDGISQRIYNIQVNVHRLVPDSLYFSEMASTDLPTSLPLTQVTEQKAVKQGKALLCLTRGADGVMCLARSTDAYGCEWDFTSVAIGQSVDVRSFTATDEGLYILGTDGTLLRSADGREWAATDSRWATIIAPYGTRLLGLEASAAAPSGYMFVEYPATSQGTAAPAAFPLKGSSQAMELATPWAQHPQIMICGGLTIGGELTGATWAFDGSQWAKIGGGLPAAEGYTVAPYTVCRTDTLTWRVSAENVLLAFGGWDAKGSPSRTVYLTRDMGMAWHKADDNLQLPAFVPAMAYADMLTQATTLPGADTYAGRWNVRLRAVSPITEWECPYLYIFGGRRANGTLNTTLWRGAINYLTFKPLQ